MTMTELTFDFDALALDELGIEDIDADFNGGGCIATTSSIACASSASSCAGTAGSIGTASSFSLF